MAASTTTAIDVAQLIDERELSGLQILTIALCGMVTLLDGIDTQSIGIAAPLIIKALGIKPAAFGPVFSAALFGAMVGALAFGPIADRYGRKRVLAAATAMFGLFTLTTALANSFESLVTFRFLAGLGLGGATPCFIAMTSEYAPKRLRATLVALMWACFPLGGMIGGFVNAYIIQNYGWHEIFYVGGVLPLLVAVAIALFMPESLRFLMTRGENKERVHQIVARMYRDFASWTPRFVTREEKLGGVAVGHLFTEGRGTMTLLLWIPFFMGFGTLSVSSLWSPTLLNMAGIPPHTASILIGIYGIGGFLGNAIAGKLLDKFGIAWVPVPAMLLGAAAIIGLGYNASSVPVAAFCMFFTSGFIGMGVACSIVLASTVYPTAMRSTGVGWAMGAGRLGQVIAPLVTGAVLGLGWKPAQIMVLIGVAPILGALFLLLLQWHLRGRTNENVATPQPGAPHLHR